MIATRREFMKFSAAAAAGLVLRPVSKPDLSASDICQSHACSLVYQGSKYWRQILRPGDAILGPILVYHWRFESVKKLHSCIEMKLSTGNSVLFKNVVNQMGVIWWEAEPDRRLFVAHGSEVVFGCSSNSGLCTVSFEKLT